MTRFTDVTPLGLPEAGLTVGGLTYIQIKRRLKLAEPHESGSVTEEQRRFVGAWPEAVRPRPSEARVVVVDDFDRELARFARWLKERPDEHAELLADPELASRDAQVRHRANGKLPSMTESEAERLGKPSTVRTYRSDR